MNASAPFAPNPPTPDQITAITAVLRLPHPDIPWAERETARQMHAGIEAKFCDALGRGHSRVFMSDPTVAYYRFYSLFLNAWAAHATKGRYMARILYFTTMPAAAVTALAQLQSEGRVKAIAITPRHDGTVEMTRLSTLLRSSANALLLSAPYVSPFGHRLRPRDIDELRELAIARGCNTALHLDFSYFSGTLVGLAAELGMAQRGLDPANPMIPAYTADLSYTTLTDGFAVFVAHELATGVNLRLTWRESNVAASAFLVGQRSALARFGASAGDPVAALSETRDILRAASGSGGATQILTYGVFRSSSFLNAIVTLNDLSVAPAGDAEHTAFAPDTLVFCCIRGGRTVPAHTLQEWALQQHKTYIHRVDMSEAVECDEVERPALREMLVLTTIPDWLPWLLAHAYGVVRKT